METDLDVLFTKPPGEFIAARNELAKQALAAKDRALAAKIRSLRRPSAVVWIVNQIARRHPGDVEALVNATTKLRLAQRRGDVGEQRTAGGERRSAIAKLLAAGRQIQASAGAPTVTPAKISATLLGASVEEAYAELLLHGRLTEELEPPGLESLLASAPKATRLERERESEQATAKQQARGQRDERKRHEAEAKARRALEREAAEAERVAVRAERAASALEEHAAKIADRARAARSRADEQRKRAEALLSLLSQTGQNR